MKDKLYIKGNDVSDNDHLIDFRKITWWRGFWVGIFIGLVPATFLFILLQKLINASL